VGSVAFPAVGLTSLGQALSWSSSLIPIQVTKSRRDFSVTATRCSTPDWVSAGAATAIAG
jgi:hypothetical protein